MRKSLSLLTIFGLLLAGGMTFAGKGNGNGGNNNEGPTPTPETYAIAYFGPLPGGTYASPLGMNNHAEIVGRADGGDGWPHGFVYSPANGIVDLNDQFRADGLVAPDGGPLSFDETTATGWLVGWAQDINDSGQVICVLGKLDAGTVVDEIPARYTPAWASPSGIPGLDALEWDVSTYGWPRVYAINNNGDVVGGSSLGGGFLWSDSQIGANGQLHVNILPHASVDVNDEDGSGRIQIIGDNHRYSVDVNTLAISDDNDLGTLFRKSRSTSDWAVQINNQGDVAGNSQDVSKPFQRVQNGYRYRDGDGLADLGTLGGGTTLAVSINNSGDIIGISNTFTGDFHVFVYSDAFGGMTDLSAAVPGVVLTPPDGNGVGVTAINDFGDICGAGYILIRQP